MKIFFLSIFIVICAQVSAQDLLQSRHNSYYTLVYKVTNDKAETLHKKLWLKESMKVRHGIPMKPHVLLKQLCRHYLRNIIRQ